MSGLDRDAVLKTISSRSYWKVEVVPATPFEADYLKDKQPMRQLLADASVEFRGWDYPHVPPYDNENHSIYPKSDGWECVANYGWHKEVWRFWQSGLFAHVFADFADWIDEDPWGSARGIPAGKSYLDPLMTLYRATEILLFARKLAGALPDNPSLSVSVKITRLRDRQLQPILSPTRHWFGEYICKGEDIGHVFKEELVSHEEPDQEIFEKARKGMIELYQLFGWNTFSEQVMLDDQQRLIARNLH